MVLDGPGVALPSGCPGCILPSWQCKSSRCSWCGSICLLRGVLTQSEDVAVKASSQVTADKPVNNSSPTIKFSPVGSEQPLSQSEQALNHRISVPDIRAAFILTQQLLLLLEHSS